MPHCQDAAGCTSVSLASLPSPGCSSHKGNEENAVYSNIGLLNAPANGVEVEWESDSSIAPFLKLTKVGRSLQGVKIRTV
jgi:hypothetical protein